MTYICTANTNMQAVILFFMFSYIMPVNLLPSESCDFVSGDCIKAFADDHFRLLMKSMWCPVICEFSSVPWEGPAYLFIMTMVSSLYTIASTMVHCSTYIIFSILGCMIFSFPLEYFFSYRWHSKLGILTNKSFLLVD